MTTDISIITKYFPYISEKQAEQFSALKHLYEEWNAQINVISRKDIDLLYERHILHSLGIAQIVKFKPGTKILDVGTGGGFPGIPLAILFPECKFHLVDSIGKKIKVVNGVSESLGLINLKAQHGRAEDVNDKFDFIVSRAVTNLSDFYGWIRKKISSNDFNDFANGILYLKGGDLAEELNNFEDMLKYLFAVNLKTNRPLPDDIISVFDLQNYFEEEFFETKKVVYVKRFI